MKMNKRNREALGLSLVVSALSLTVTFIVLLFRKRSLLAAIAALAAVESAAGAVLLTGADDVAKEKVAQIREKRAARAAAKAAAAELEEELLEEIEVELYEESDEEAADSAEEAAQPTEAAEEQ